MHIRTHAKYLLAAASLVSLISSQALAGTCTLADRNFPAVQDFIEMSCKPLPNGTAGVATVNAFVDNGVKKVQAKLISGINGNIAQAEGVTAAGVVLCTITDTVIDGNPATSNACPATVVKWHGKITF